MGSTPIRSTDNDIGLMVQGEDTRTAFWKSGFNSRWVHLIRSKLRKAQTVKMYILIKDSVPLGYAMVAAAHASLAAYLKFRDCEEVQQWLGGPFRKVVCKVSNEDFEKAKAVADHVVLTESALEGQEVAIAFKPRDEWPRAFKHFALYR
jgi:hypothetical protein